jgi:hypothetical protein
MKINLIRKFVLCFLAAWLALVIFTDFVVAPTVFQTVSKRVEAGELGMKVFSALGFFEVIVGIILFLLGLVVLKRFRTKRAGSLFLLATCLFAFALLGKFYLTPELTRLNLKKYTMDEQSIEYQKVQSQHHFLHNFYIKLDTFKMLFLLTGLSLSFGVSRFDQETLFRLPLRRKK